VRLKPHQPVGHVAACVLQLLRETPRSGPRRSAPRKLHQHRHLLPGLRGLYDEGRDDGAVRARPVQASPLMARYLVHHKSMPVTYQRVSQGLRSPSPDNRGAAESCIWDSCEFPEAVLTIPQVVRGPVPGLTRHLPWVLSALAAGPRGCLTFGSCMALCTKWSTLVPKLWKGWCTSRSQRSDRLKDVLALYTPPSTRHKVTSVHHITSNHSKPQTAHAAHPSPAQHRLCDGRQVQ